MIKVIDDIIECMVLIDELLCKTINASKGGSLVLTVDVDNAAANHLYEKMGFVEIPENNILTEELKI